MGFKLQELLFWGQVAALSTLWPLVGNQFTAPSLSKHCLPECFSVVEVDFHFWQIIADVLLAQLVSFPLLESSCICWRLAPDWKFSQFLTRSGELDRNRFFLFWNFKRINLATEWIFFFLFFVDFSNKMKKNQQKDIWYVNFHSICVCLSVLPQTLIFLTSELLNPQLSSREGVCLGVWCAVHSLPCTGPTWAEKCDCVGDLDSWNPNRKLPPPPNPHPLRRCCPNRPTLGNAAGAGDKL